MAKSDIMMQGQCWEDYPFKVEMLSVKPKNFGEIDEDRALKLNGKLFSFEYGDVSQGSYIKFYWVINEESVVVACRYSAFGAPALIASADISALLCRNKSIDEVSKLNYKSIEYFLRDHPSNPALPLQKRYETLFITNAIKFGVSKFKGELKEEKSKVVCSCSGTTKEDIVNAIKEFDLISIEEIAGYTGAGAYCSKCISETPNHKQDEYLIDILKATRDEIEAEKNSSNIDTSKDFKSMNIEEKRLVIDKVIDDYIRAMLIMDGGDMEILDIKENGEHTDIYIRYLGACSGCASASTGTLFAIEGILKQKLNPNIRVLPL